MSMACTAEHNARAASSIVETLAGAGITHAVISPGSRNTPLVLALEASSIDTHMVLDERAAGFLALGISRLSNVPPVLVCTSGSAAGHYLPAVMEASESLLPLLILTADRPPESQHCGAPQTTQQQQLFGSFCRWFANLNASRSDGSDLSPYRWLRSMSARAVREASSSPPGPVHLNIPFYEPLWEPGVEFEAPVSPARCVVASEPSLAGAQIDELLEQFSRSKRGVVFCGAGLAVDPDAGRELVGFASRMGWPVLAEPTSQIRCGEHGVNGIVATADALLRDDRVAGLLKPDLIIRVGQAPLSESVQRWMRDYGRERTLLVHPHGRWLDPDGLADTLVVAHPSTLFAQLNERSSGRELCTRERDVWFRAWMDADAAATGAISAASEGELWEASAVRTLIQCMPPESFVHVAASMPIRDTDSFAPVCSKNLTVVANRGLNGIDGLIATAAGGCIATRKHGALLCGDLSFLHDIDGLMAAAELGVPLTVVVLNNGGGGIFEQLPIAEHPTAFARCFLTPQSADVSAVSRATAPYYEKVKTVDELRAALSSEQVGLRVIEVPLDRQRSAERRETTWNSVAARARGQTETALLDAGAAA